MPVATHAFLCGLWDGMHLWVQWDDTAPDAGYRLQVRLRPNDQAAWEAWRDVSAKPLRRAWAVVPLWREGWAAQARVAVAEELKVDRTPSALVESLEIPDAALNSQLSTLNWSPATEVTFQHARCAFEIATETTRVHYLHGTEFSTKVDGAPCHWRLDDDVELEPGEKVRLEMTAGATGYSQLDRAGHFDLRPAPGLRIRNLEPSVDDVRETGRDFTMLAPRPRDAPLKVTFRRKTPPA